jgi:16S rRNA (cytosine967-C5)-methyltransferase
LRRNPDLKWRQSPQGLWRTDGQAGRHPASAARLLKPGGRLVYATCSVLPQENEAIAEAFSGANPAERSARLPVVELLEARRRCRRRSLCSGADSYLRLWPHRHSTDGFFAAAWEKVQG